ncbi:MAG: thermonuclease family protein [Myxococcota bacterium]|nr:thermonuclease family protein [Myxococcota bacterium]
MGFRWLLLTAALLGSTGCRDPLDEVPILGPSYCAPDRTAQVACVLDGDTVDLDGCGDEASERVRFLGTAAPEIANGATAAECYGEEARAFLSQVALGREVSVLYDNECTDIYDRSLAWLFIDVDLDDEIVPILEDLDDFGLNDEEDGYRVLLNTLMIRAGYAEEYSGVGSGDAERFSGEAARAEEAAQSEGRGLYAADACGR